MDYKKLASDVKLCGRSPASFQCMGGCSYYSGGNMMKCIPRMTEDAASAITDLLSRAEAAEARSEKAERERDAAIQDIFEAAPAKCFWCKHQDHKWLSDGKMDDLCYTCLKNNKCNWEWCGEKEE